MKGTHIMSVPKGSVLRDGDTLIVGGITLVSHEDLLKLIDDPGKATGRGIEIINKKSDDVYVEDSRHAGRFCKIVASVYLSREPLTDEEKEAVAAMAAESKARQDKKKADAAAEHAQHTKNVRELVAQTMLDTLDSVGARK